MSLESHNITSIVIKKDTGEEVASVSEDQPQPMLISANMTNAAVTGNLTGVDNIRGYTLYII